MGKAFFLCTKKLNFDTIRNKLNLLQYMANSEFKKDMEELVRLFTKLKQKADNKELYGFDAKQMKSIELFIQSYDLFKDEMNEEMLGEVGGPVKDMIKQMIEQLREELGEDDMLYSKPEPQEPRVITKDADSKVEVSPSLEEIDRMLALPDLPVDEMNRLLDERAKKIKKDNNEE